MEAQAKKVEAEQQKLQADEQKLAAMQYAASNGLEYDPNQANAQQGVSGTPYSVQSDTNQGFAPQNAAIGTIPDVANAMEDMDEPQPGCVHCTGVE